MIVGLFLAVAGLVQADAGQAEAASFRLDPDQTVFAVITYKAGFASRLAHNHLIVAGEYESRFEFDPDSPLQSVFELEVPVRGLIVDDPRLRDSWAGRLAELDLTDDLGTPGEDDRRKIREEMLDDDQLDAERHPTIHVRLMGIVETSSRIGEEDFPLTAEVAFTIRGTTVQRSVPLRYTLLGDELWIEAVGRLEFESFGIEPYSAFLGSVKNRDEFDLYLSTRAVR